MQKIFIFFFFTCFSLLANAQDSTRLNQKFKFKDGFYNTLAELRQNKPSAALTDFKGNIVNKSSENLAQLTPSENTQTVDIQRVWGVVLNGVPYLRYQTDTTKKQSSDFQAIQILGKLCYFSYSTDEIKTIPMPVYDPIGGKLLYTGKVKNKERATFRKVFNIMDGNIVDLNIESLKRLTADDKKLQKSVADLNANDPLQRLLKTLQIYNDRNAVFIK